MKHIAGRLLPFPQTESNQPEQRIEYPAAIRTHRHRGTQQNFPRVRRLGFV